MVAIFSRDAILVEMPQCTYRDSMDRSRAAGGREHPASSHVHPAVSCGCSNGEHLVYWDLFGPQNCRLSLLEGHLKERLNVALQRSETH
jgi:hypothetical protein